MSTPALYVSIFFSVCLVHLFFSLFFASLSIFDSLFLNQSLSLSIYIYIYRERERGSLTCGKFTGVSLWGFKWILMKINVSIIVHFYLDISVSIFFEHTSYFFENWFFFLLAFLNKLIFMSETALICHNFNLSGLLKGLLFACIPSIFLFPVFHLWHQRKKKDF